MDRVKQVINDICVDKQLEFNFIYGDLFLRLEAQLDRALAQKDRTMIQYNKNMRAIEALT